MSSIHLHRPYDLDRLRRRADAIGLRYGWPSDQDRAARPHVVRLPVSRARLGDRRFEHLFVATRAAALHIDRECIVEAVYEDHERAGYTFRFATAIDAARLNLCHERLLAGRPTGLSKAAP